MPRKRRGTTGVVFGAGRLPEAQRRHGHLRLLNVEIGVHARGSGRGRGRGRTAQPGREQQRLAGGALRVRPANRRHGVAAVGTRSRLRVRMTEAVVAREAGEPQTADDGEHVTDGLQRVRVANQLHFGGYVAVTVLSLCRPTTEIVALESTWLAGPHPAARIATTRADHVRIRPSLSRGATIDRTRLCVVQGGCQRRLPCEREASPLTAVGDSTGAVRRTSRGALPLLPTSAICRPSNRQLSRLAQVPSTRASQEPSARAAVAATPSARGSSCSAGRG